jgi:EAL domain-containing protein (putative c-di-GMP-specific phosphodiesterase class I)
VATVERGESLPEVSTVVARCRVALRRGLAQGFPQVGVFQERHAEDELDDFELAALLQQAVEEGRFQLAYLPKVAMTTGTVLGVEALIRWNMPSGESVPPERLLNVADDAGLLDEVGTWALREACRQAAQWSLAGLRLPVSVNISGGQFRRGDLVDETRMALSEAGLQGEQLTVEVSERALARDAATVRDQLAEVRVAGARVSIEDVGAGALPFATLRTVPLDEIKIDQSLVARLPGSAQDRAAVDLVLHEARARSVPCVAEGVENAAQWAYLAEQGWPAAQGWLVCRPLAPEAVPDFCAASGARVAP